MVYVSITGLQLIKPWHAIRFWWHALRSMAQAKAAQGNISAAAKTINGVHHTLTVWKDELAMRTFVTTGPHLKAMRAFHFIATGKTLGFYTDIVPDWNSVHELWLEKAKVVSSPLLQNL